MYDIRDLHNNTDSVEIDGQWVPARPVNTHYRTLRERLRDAWWVFAGRADAVIWPGQ